MWSYYGAKTNLVDFYPAPKHDKIIEPFAGTARNALKYFEHEVLLVDKYDVIVKIWQWLQKCSPNDVLKLPVVGAGQYFDEFTFDCPEAKWLCQFLHGCADYEPRKKPTRRKTIDRPKTVPKRYKNVASNLFKIKHWRICLGSFDSIENQVATWFIDPPYQFGGHVYKCSNKHIQYKQLRDWSMARSGQVIVCENMRADWMPFKPIISQRGQLKTQTEAIYTNEPSAYDNEQLKMAI